MVHEVEISAGFDGLATGFWESIYPILVLDKQVVLVGIEAVVEI
jgi:hypothetical protein